MRVITDAGGNIVWRWDNTEPFGNNMPNQNPSGQGTFEFPLRFPGQYADRETGLNYNVNRDYDASIGAYKQSDPIGLNGGVNTYAYVGGNPLSRIDPLGLWSFSMEAYFGIGGGINLAYSNGTWELTGRLGVGFGEGLNYDPNGTPSKHAMNCGSGYIARTSVNAAAGVGVGPAGVGGSFTVATGNALTTHVGGGYSSIAPTGAFDRGDNIGERLSASFGVDFGSYWNQ